MRARRAGATPSAMIGRCFLLVAGLILFFWAGERPFVPDARVAAESLPGRLSNREFWKIISDFSEPNGSFRSDNLLSNEIGFANVIPDLIRVAKPGRVYMGVGPEQNFTYVAALRPKMAFIIDIRRGNLDLHLMYKALFELSDDRAEFMSRLFSKKRPDGLGPRSTAQEISAAYSDVETSEALYKANLEAIENHLIVKRRFPLSLEDRQGIEYVYHAFYAFGPAIKYSSTQGGLRGFNQPTYADLMVAASGNGQARSYLSTEESFSFVKRLQTKNLLVPVVGDFAGAKAIRAVGKYLTQHGATVSAFYLSNVEQFLGGTWDIFCSNVTTLPLDETSTFIRFVRDGRYRQGMGLNFELGAVAAEVKACVSSGNG